MANNYPTVEYGSYGEPVRQLQEALNKVGYSLEVDGGFGEKTEAAVIDYQRKNGLAVDGVVGSETMGSLLGQIMAMGGSAAGDSTSKGVLSGVSDETADKLSQLEKGYSASDEVNAAQKEYESWAALQPKAYESSFEAQLSALYDELSGRGGFRYDPDKDAAYQRYAAIYTRQGKAAMEDTLGKAAALTGGYDSTYAQGAAQQAYHQHLQALGELLPQLEENARDAYDAEGKALLQRYDLLQQREAAEFDAWQQEEKLWRESSEEARKAYETLRKEDYEAYETLLKYYADKAQAEQKASDGRVVNSGKVKEEAAEKGSLSSTAAESLQRAMGNYLKGGDEVSAAALAQQYAARLTPAQKKQVAALFEKYGKAIAL